MPNIQSRLFCQVVNITGRGPVLFLQAAALALATAAAAQQAPDAEPELAQSREDAQPGQPYDVGTFGDWRVRCLRVDDRATEPCEMSQILLSEDGSPTAEMSFFPVRQGQVALGATMVTPLETLLTRNVTFKIDAREEKQYPFNFCNRQGCIAQVGFTQDEVDALKAGTSARMTIYPVAAPDTPVNLTLSLSGFTAAHTALTGGIE